MINASTTYTYYKAWTKHAFITYIFIFMRENHWMFFHPNKNGHGSHIWLPPWYENNTCHMTWMKQTHFNVKTPPNPPPTAHPITSQWKEATWKWQGNPSNANYIFAPFPLLLSLSFGEEWGRAERSIHLERSSCHFYTYFFH